MDEDNKTCENCNREIPSGNYTIHLVHCVRNIRVCPVCKEAVPLTELEEHTEKLHKLMPCKQCGEKVRGTDMEDHIRDSCDHTIQTCRWCDLELSRRELPLHEGYCGARTEECPQCGEFVMHKYRQLHLDSNHGFVRLDDDPIPRPQRLRAVASTSMSVIGSGVVYQRPANRLPRLLDLPDQPSANPVLARLIDAITEANATDYFGVSRVIHTQSPRSPDAAPDQGSSNDGRNFNRWQVIGLTTPRNVAQVNAADVPGTSSDSKSAPRGAIKKRKAPKPPSVSTPESQPDQSQATPVGRTYSLFPSTSTSAPNTPISGPMTGPIRGPKSGPLPGPNNRSNLPLSGNDNAPGANGRQTENTSNEDQKRRGSVPVNSPAKQSELDRDHEMTNAEDFRNVKPMTTEEFMKRFRQLQLDNSKRGESSRLERSPRKEENSPTSEDRFSAIKSSLKELRRGLNEVTAPYSNSNINANDRGNTSRDNPDTPTKKSSKSNSDDGSEGTRDNSPRGGETEGVDDIDWGQDAARGEEIPWRDVAEGNNSSWGGDPGWGGDSSWGGEVAAVDASGWGVVAVGDGGGGGGACGVDVIDVKLPCEFCGTLIQASDLVQHQTGCRPDLAQLLPAADQEDQQEPYIPCEYCDHRMPLELIGEHQERCSRKMKRMFMK
ncbi:PREDICTED: uncharacterized protein LOC106109430 [Papilio polytes]|uniref:uncharacterized protein LOC106109430 n=1 Tax=Papilio polytes TaxID=76194 RepID=UPI000676A69E|nr:PREDICTED: uncharacterized protein LOC106109430 [Papilio polytes]